MIVGDLRHVIEIEHHPCGLRLVNARDSSGRKVAISKQRAIAAQPVIDRIRIGNR